LGNDGILGFIFILLEISFRYTPYSTRNIIGIWSIFYVKNLAKCNFKNEIFITSYLIIAKKHAKYLKNVEK